MEEFVEPDAERACDLERQLESRGVLLLFDRDEGLPRHADRASELGLREPRSLAMRADAVGHQRRLDHQTSPLR
ncbi:hypothetical protein D3C73_1644390 [compost metagenome]